MDCRNTPCPEPSYNDKSVKSASAFDRTLRSDGFVRELTKLIVREYYSLLRPSVRMLHEQACCRIAEREAVTGTTLAKPSLSTIYRLIRNHPKKLTDRRRCRRHSTRRGRTVNKTSNRAAANRAANGR